MASYGNHSGNGHYEARRRGHQGASAYQSSHHKRGGYSKRGQEQGYQAVGSEASGYNQGRGYANGHHRANGYKAVGTPSPGQERSSAGVAEGQTVQKPASQNAQVAKAKGKGAECLSPVAVASQSQTQTVLVAPTMCLNSQGPARPAKKIWQEEEYSGVNRVGASQSETLPVPPPPKHKCSGIASGLSTNECLQRPQTEQVTETAASSVRVDDEQGSLGKRSLSEAGDLKLVGTKANICDYLDSLWNLEQCLDTLNSQQLDLSKITSEELVDMTQEVVNHQVNHEVKLKLTERQIKPDFSNFAL